MSCAFGPRTAEDRDGSRFNQLRIGMLFEDPKTRELLRRIVGRLCKDPFLADDLMQEGIIHLWMMEQERPAQTESWYLQSCRFHLNNEMQRGRSVDAFKRHGQRISIVLGETETEDWEIPCDEGFYSEISIREIFGMLEAALSPVEKRVLGLLERGLRVQQIAGRIGISHQAVSKHRAKIARLAAELGITLKPS